MLKKIMTIIKSLIWLTICPIHYIDLCISLHCKQAEKPIRMCIVTIKWNIHTHESSFHSINRIEKLNNCPIEYSTENDIFSYKIQNFPSVFTFVDFLQLYVYNILLLCQVDCRKYFEKLLFFPFQLKSTFNSTCFFFIVVILTY